MDGFTGGAVWLSTDACGDTDIGLKRIAIRTRGGRPFLFACPIQSPLRECPLIPPARCSCFRRATALNDLLLAEDHYRQDDRRERIRNPQRRLRQMDEQMARGEYPLIRGDIG